MLKSNISKVSLIMVMIIIMLGSSTGLAGQLIAKGSYKVYIPTAYSKDSKLPMVVMLHGSTQSSEIAIRDTGFNLLAEKENFIVLYPEKEDFKFKNAWAFWEDQNRGEGDAEELARLTKKIIKEYNADESRVYVTGISAGGAMAVIMGITYPDVFTAVSSGCGVSYRACSEWGPNLNAALVSNNNSYKEAAYDALKAMKKNSVYRKVPFQVIHGDKDMRIALTHAFESAEQYAIINGIDFKPSDYSSTDQLEVTKYADSEGQRLVEIVIIKGMHHAWSGVAGGRNTYPQGPSQSEMAWNFFKQFKK